MPEQLPSAPPVRIYGPPAVGASPRDVAGVGANFVAGGLSVIEAQDMVGEMQQLAAQAAFSMAPKIMEKVRRIQEARFFELQQSVAALPSMAGYINRIQVLTLIQAAASRIPQL